jgi:hypothetical protein
VRQVATRAQREIVCSRRVFNCGGRPLSFTVRRTVSTSAHRNVELPSGGKSILVFLVWLLGCPLIGGLVAFLDGNHGSIGYLVIGMYVGVFGALMHTFLSRRQSFVSLGYTQQLLIAAAAPALPLLAFAFITIAFVPTDPGFLRDFALPTVMYSLVAAWAGTAILDASV